MPHSIRPDVAPTEESSHTMSQVDAIKCESNAYPQDMEMVDSPAMQAAKVSLEDLFGDEDSDPDEFSSSAPTKHLKSEEEPSQPVPL